MVKLRSFINNLVEGFAVSPEGIDQLRKRSVLVQVAILSVDLPEDVAEAVRTAYLSICREAGVEDVAVAVRSSAAGEDSRKKAFAGLQDTYLNIVGEENAVEAYLWDCSSAYNLRSMTYRREAIRDAVAQAERTGDDEIADIAKKEWAIENTSLSVCIMRMIEPVISGTAFSADTATGCRGTDRRDLVSIDASYGLGEAVVGGLVSATTGPRWSSGTWATRTRRSSTTSGAAPRSSRSTRTRSAAGPCPCPRPRKWPAACARSPCPTAT
jgi:pyruvate,water dikinase